MFNFEDFLVRARARLLPQPAITWDYSDDDMNAKARMIPVGVKPKPAAVLVPIILRDEPMVLLTQRHAGLSQHAGQIAFPGGRIDDGESPLQAALREAREEVGLVPSSVNWIGYLPSYLTVTAYQVVPVVALLEPGFGLVLQSDEVDEAFEVPLAFLMTPENCQRQSREWQGMMRHYYVYQFANRHIWGATAGMIRSLHDSLYP